MSTREAAPVRPPQAHKIDTAAVERPIPSGTNAAGFGSDVVAEVLRELDIPYIALNPGASYRGLHDSLVNLSSATRAPQMLLCLHEEAAVAIAHGYAKVTGKAMARRGALQCRAVPRHHGDLQRLVRPHADRHSRRHRARSMPTKRRPWIDWIHTAADQGAIVRPYTKWDDQPASPAAARESLLRADWLANTAPQGPVYINLDAEMQELVLRAAAAAARRQRVTCRRSPAPVRRRSSGRRRSWLKAAKNPLILAGRVSRDETAWKQRASRSPRRSARACSPTSRSARRSRPTIRCTSTRRWCFTKDELTPLLKEADVILSLDWVDLAGTLKAARRTAGRQGDPGFARPSAPQRLEHGLPGAAAGRSASSRPMPDTATAALVQAIGRPARARPPAGPRAAAA